MNNERPPAVPVADDQTRPQAPTPLETWTAGMFDGLVNGRNGMRPGDYTEEDVRETFRCWLDERAANGFTPPAPPVERAQPDGAVWGAIRPFLTRFAANYGVDDPTARAALDVLAIEIAEAVAAAGSQPVRERADTPRVWVDDEGDLVVGERAGPTIGLRDGRTMTVFRDYSLTDEQAIAALTAAADPGTGA